MKTIRLTVGLSDNRSVYLPDNVALDCLDNLITRLDKEKGN